MPDRNLLKLGDQIRLLRVPTEDLKQRERELAEGGHEQPGHTANTIERVIAKDPIVIIDDIDEWGYPWYSYELQAKDGETEHHLIAVLDDDSWEFVER